ncbi:hypothetical protein [Weizmannia phage Youna2]
MIGPTPLRKPRNNTGYYRILPTHIELYDANYNHLQNVRSWKELERFGKRYGFYFKRR